MMSAVVCGKRSFFEDLESAAGSPGSSSPLAYKRFRCSSPARFTYSPPSQPSPVDQLKALFPDMQIQLLEKALEEAGNGIDSAINRLKELHLENAINSAEEKIINIGDTSVDVTGTPLGEPQLQNNLPADGAAWVDLIVNEMMSATSVDDAKSRAARVLESLEKAISVQTGVKVAEDVHKENMMLKEQIEALLRDNTILKRAVSIQHERQKEYDERNAEVQQLKQLLSQYQEQIRTLEVSNYALTMHLRQAQQSNSIPGHFHPDVF
ncbi:uncharacterized protein LOC131004270 [Salvia miltiorrhiza]|uniref:uncharacterized protein LOC131004270 n=1 Tax=Salvia miltiorrhiza TaxID=226208 RepID=UPI0025AC5968|nr:uncharacterized protein LOC131004270 [Salvia miltiorrhiza]